MVRSAARATARLVLVVCLVLVVGPGTLDSAASAGERHASAVVSTAVRVRIVDNAFKPKVVTVPRGTRVRWVNRGTAVHSVKGRTGSWGSDLLQPGDRYGRVFRKAGTYAYYCTVHPTMRGTIVVT
jgi:plastocyanin